MKTQILNLKILMLLAILLMGTVAHAETDQFLNEKEQRAAFLPLSRIPKEFPWPSPLIGTGKLLKDDIRNLITTEIEKTAENTQLTMPEIHFLNTKQWAAYVNFEHFVSLEAEGVPTGFGINFFYSDELPPKSLPIMEINEHGQLLVWWESCNYYKTDSKSCQQILASLISHEWGHLKQWQRLRRNVSSFTEKWLDIQHYQCREVEVYVSQVRSGEVDREALGHHSLQSYYKGCKGSRWTQEFSESIKFFEDVTT